MLCLIRCVPSQQQVQQQQSLLEKSLANEKILSDKLARAEEEAVKQAKAVNDLSVKLDRSSKAAEEAQARVRCVYDAEFSLFTIAVVGFQCAWTVAFDVKFDCMMTINDGLTDDLFSVEIKLLCAL